LNFLVLKQTKGGMNDRATHEKVEYLMDSISFCVTHIKAWCVISYIWFPPTFPFDVINLH